MAMKAILDEVGKYVEEMKWEDILTTLTENSKISREQINQSYGLLCILGQVR